MSTLDDSSFWKLLDALLSLVVGYKQEHPVSDASIALKLERLSKQITESYETHHDQFQEQDDPAEDSRSETDRAVDEVLAYAARELKQTNVVPGQPTESRLDNNAIEQSPTIRTNAANDATDSVEAIASTNVDSEIPDQTSPASLTSHQTGETVILDAQQRSEHGNGEAEDNLGGAGRAKNRPSSRKTFVTRQKLSSPRVPKRKRRTADAEEAQKHAKAHHATRQELSGVLDSVVSVPQIKPWNIYEEFMHRSSQTVAGYDHNRCYLLTKFFFAIGSPDAFSYLRDVCDMIRTNDFNPFHSADGAVGMIRSLDRLETSAHAVAVLRRFHLVNLCASRSQLQADLQLPSKRPASNARDMGAADVSSRVGSQVLATIMSEAYPELKPTRASRTKGKDEYGRKLRVLQDRLLAGQRWSMLANMFAPGVLALVPTHGGYQLSNTDFERLPAGAIHMLLDVLELYRGDFLREVSQAVSAITLGSLERPRFRFENEDNDVLRKEQYDSEQLLDLCKVENGPPDA